MVDPRCRKLPTLDHPFSPPSLYRADSADCRFWVGTGKQIGPTVTFGPECRGPLKGVSRPYFPALLVSRPGSVLFRRDLGVTSFKVLYEVCHPRAGSRASTHRPLCSSTVIP